MLKSERKLEKARESSDWVKLSEIKWETRGGEWISTPEGNLQPKETTKNTIAIAPFCVGRAFELRTDVEMVSLQSQQRVDFYAVVGFRYHAVNFGAFGIFCRTRITIATAYSCGKYYKLCRHHFLDFEQAGSLFQVLR